MKQYIIEVEGMRCGMCEAHVNDVVRKVSGVIKVSSSHVKKETVVICNDDVTIDAIKDAINKEGYTTNNYKENKVEKKLFGYKIIK